FLFAGHAVIRGDHNQRVFQDVELAVTVEDLAHFAVYKSGLGEYAGGVLAILVAFGVNGLVEDNHKGGNLGRVRKHIEGGGGHIAAIFGAGVAVAVGTAILQHEMLNGSGGVTALFEGFGYGHGIVEAGSADDLVFLFQVNLVATDAGGVGEGAGNNAGH